MPTPRAWSRNELLTAGLLYCRIPFGRFHQRNPDLIEFADRIGRSPSAVAMKLCNLASLDPVITGTGRSGLPGASAADRELWIEMNADWPAFSIAAIEAADSLGFPTNESAEEHPSQTDENFTGHERLATRAQRVGQNLFRHAVLTAYDYRCCITGLAVPKLLVASHIVPWREDPKNRLNPANGLCLSALHDRAFDVGLITIRDDWTVVVSPSLRDAPDDFCSQTITDYEDRPIVIPEKFGPSKDFLDYHRKEVFLR